MDLRIAACLIVRDEAETIIRCLDAAAKLADAVVLIDTGSSDGTPEIVATWAEEHDVELHMRSDEWQNFKVNRSALMSFAADKADWLLLLDADLVIHAPEPLPDLEQADCWQGRVRFGALDYTLPFLVRAGKPWYFEGVAHSYLACAEPFDEAEMPGLWVEDYSSTGREKLERDLELLSAEHARNPRDPRTAFYLAQTYFDLGMFPEAIQTYRTRAYMGGWDEESFYARYRLGCLLCEHVSFAEGAKELLAAWELRPQRIEPLRVLANVANNVADKFPLPTDRLFVHKNDYAAKPEIEVVELPPLPPLDPGERRRPRHTVRNGLRASEVSAVIVTRGNVDLEPILATIPFDDIVIWDNSKREHDYKAFGRYAAIPETKNPVIFFQDDDLLFTAHDELLAAYEPGKLVCNMDDSWIDACGYRDLVGMQGAGSLCDARLPAEVFARYLAAHPWDDDCLTEADFVFGVLCPFTVISLPYEAFDYADAPDRLYTQSWQPARKQAMIERCRALLEEPVAA